MREAKIVGMCVLLISITLLWLYMGEFLEQLSEQDKPYRDAKTVSIANWNLNIFGKTKAANATLLQEYAEKMRQYDILFVQEIRDANSSSFEQLCGFLPEYTCNASSRAGRSSSKEQYGLLYKNETQKGEEIHLIGWQDYNPDVLDRWERPPLAVTFNISNYLFTIYNIHTKPSEVQKELAELESLIPNRGNVIIIGDLNADCGYYQASREHEFLSWHWIIKDNEDTTVARTKCAYDRVILNDDAFKEYNNKGIDSLHIDTSLSDHYLVYFLLETKER